MQCDEAEIFEKYRELLQIEAEISDSEWEFYRSLAHIERYKKGEFFLRPGDPGYKFAFVVKGIFKKYFYTLKGDTYITDFRLEGHMLSDYSAVIQKSEAKLEIEALEDSTVITINSPVAREEMGDKGVTWQRVGRVIAERGYMEKSEREWDLLCLEARERYEKFCEKFAGNVDRIKKSDIASYLGITNVSLSRIINSNR